MLVGIATIHGDPSYLHPILQTALDGLRPTPGSRPTANSQGEPPGARSLRASRRRGAGSRASSRRATATASAAKRPG
jgi:hypothetical protein